jgi:hypothetical protein
MLLLGKIEPYVTGYQILAIFFLELLGTPSVLGKKAVTFSKTQAM